MFTLCCYAALIKFVFVAIILLLCCCYAALTVSWVYIYIMHIFLHIILIDFDEFYENKIVKCI